MPRKRDTPKPSPTWARQDWYDHPLVYDIVHTPGTAKEMTGLERMFRRFGTPPASRRTALTVLEPACGSGRFLRVAAARGHRVIGLDLNPRMIDFARDQFKRRGLDGELHVADMSKFDLTGLRVPYRSGADLAFCLINSIRHLRSDAQLDAHLRCMAAAVRPGGIYAVGISLTHYGAEFPTEEVFEGRRGGCRVVQLAQFLPPEARFERVLNHLTITTPAGEHHLDNAFELRAYSGSQWKRAVDRSPFHVVGVVDEDAHDAVVLGTDDAWKRSNVMGYGIFILKHRP